MDVAVSAAAAVLRGRGLAESLMQDRGVMRSPTGHAVIDDNGQEIPSYADEFTTRCKVAGASTGGTDPTYATVTVGGVQRSLITAGVAIPVGSPTCKRGWVFEVTAVGPSSDPRILGRKYLVHNDPASSFKTARKLDVVEVDW